MSIICYVLTTFYLYNLGLLKQEITLNLKVNIYQYVGVEEKWEKGRKK